MKILDVNGKVVNTNIIEKQEQDLANYFIKENDIVLELGRF